MHAGRALDAPGEPSQAISVSEALRAFSVETVVAYPAKDAASAAVAAGLDTRAAFFAPLDWMKLEAGSLPAPTARTAGGVSRWLAAPQTKRYTGWTTRALALKV